MKRFNESWNNDEIKRYLKKYNILVLFNMEFGNNEAEVLIYGKMRTAFKKNLLSKIIAYYGGRSLTTEMCHKVNNLAARWYRRNVLKKKSRIINIRRGKQW